MSSVLIAAAFASGLAAIASDWNGRRRALFYVAKPLTTVLILLFAAGSMAGSASYRIWVLSVFACCLVGDVALMFHGTRAFVIGLAAFLLGHLLLIAAFVTGLPLAPLQLPPAVWVAAALFLLLIAISLRFLLPRLGRLRPWVLLYIGALAAMVLAALLRAALADTVAAWWVFGGALLFAVSDAILAYRKFVATPWWGQPLTLATYYAALGLIAWAS